MTGESEMTRDFVYGLMMRVSTRYRYILMALKRFGECLTGVSRWRCRESSMVRRGLFYDPASRRIPALYRGIGLAGTWHRLFYRVWYVCVVATISTQWCLMSIQRYVALRERLPPHGLPRCSIRIVANWRASVR